LTALLFLTESFHPVLGGGELHIRMLAGSLVRMGLPATVVTRAIDPTWSRDEVIDGIRVVRVGPAGVGRGGKYRMVPAALSSVRRLRDQFDVLVVRGTRVLGVPGLSIARSLGRPIVLQPEINGEFSGEAYTWGKRWGAMRRGFVHGATTFRNRWMKTADAFVAMSHAIESEMRAAGIESRRIHRIPHGVDLLRFRPAIREERLALRARLGLPGDATLLTYTGRLLRGKGLETLLAAFAALAPRWSTLRLMLVGSGAGQTLSIEDALRREAAAAGVGDRVLFTGRVDAVEEYLRASDVFVFPSLFEALGISLVEAAACGLPCVASRTGGIVDVVEHEQTGLLHDPGDAAALAAALERVLTDEGLAARLGNAARQKAERELDVRTSLVRYQSLFEGLARQSAAVRGRA
jgi:glycosyltransferase involved in cell wall biosynthesis